MTKTTLLRKMNPSGRPGTGNQSTLMEGNAWHNGASEGVNVRLPGVREGRKNEEAQVGGWSGFGHGVSGTADAGAGCGKEGTAETGAESFAGGAGAVERNRAEIDHHRGRFRSEERRVGKECRTWR